MGNTAKQLAGKLQGLQFVRALAVLFVVGYHTFATLAKPDLFDDKSVLPVSDRGAVGVDLFFVVSGFIIVYVSLRNDTLRPKLRVRDYLLKRAIRIFPFLWVAVVLYAIVRFAGIGEFEVGPYLNSAFVLPVGELRPNVVWTLRHELLFYCSLLSRSFFGAEPLGWFSRGRSHR